MKWLPGMLGVSRNDGTKYRILGEGEEPMRVDARLGQDLAEWPVQTGMNSLVPDLDDVATWACVMHLLQRNNVVYPSEEAILAAWAEL